MSLLPSLAAWQFAFAGFICAGLALAIHLFTRRRQRTVRWAAMDLLEQAIRHQRRLIRLVDLLLLLLRTSAVLLFGIALAQPYWSSQGEPLDAGQPVHAVLLVDNSLSMAFETLAGTLLDVAQQRARRLIEDLPAGSLVSVVPVCGSRYDEVSQPLSDRQRAVDTLDRIEVVDRSASLERVLQAASRAADSSSELTSRFILYTDSQQQNWADADRSSSTAPPPLQIVDVSPGAQENCWLAEILLPDRIADPQTPARVLVRVKSSGSSARELQVSLSVNQQPVASKSLRLVGNDEREVAFSYRFRPTQNGPAVEFARVKAAITADQLTLDDERHLLVPVAAHLPIVFVDQYGDLEAPLSGRVGESRSLRQLLAPMLSSESAERGKSWRHCRIEQLTKSLLADARLVIIAGVANPKQQVPLLRQFVEQGGQLVITAGGEFDAQAWTNTAWLAGHGLLPAPLELEPLGVLPDQTHTLAPFAIAFESLGTHPYFQLAGVTEPQLRALYAEPLFFQAIRSAPVTTAESGAASGSQHDATRDSVRWLQWSPPEETASASAAGEIQVLARFTDDERTPFLIGRRIGQGRVLFVSSGVHSSWNTLPRTNAMLIFDRLLRSMLASTLPLRNFSTQEQLTLPLVRSDSNSELTLHRPRTNAVEVVDYAFIGRDRRGVLVERPFQRGIYRLVERAASSPQKTAVPAAALELAVNGAAAESDLSTLDDSTRSRLAARNRFHWVAADRQANLAAAPIFGWDSWWWLVLLTLILLGVECLLCATVDRSVRQ